jgi:hypothetical protein
MVPVAAKPGGGDDVAAPAQAVGASSSTVHLCVKQVSALFFLFYYVCILHRLRACTATTIIILNFIVRSMDF